MSDSAPPVSPPTPSSDAGLDAVRTGDRLQHEHVAHAVGGRGRRQRDARERGIGARVDLDDVVKELTDSRTNSSRFDNSTDGVLGKAGLEKVFEPLSENQRRTLWFFFVEGYTLGEIAVKLNQTRRNVKNHYFRGLEKLRKQFPGSKLRGDAAV